MDSKATSASTAIAIARWYGLSLIHIFGICNGFQALIKLGLVPYGEIVGQKDDSPTLTFNTINRHISKMVYTKVVSNKSPWLQGAEPVSYTHLDVYKRQIMDKKSVSQNILFGMYNLAGFM